MCTGVAVLPGHHPCHSEGKYAMASLAGVATTRKEYQRDNRVLICGGSRLVMSMETYVDGVRFVRPQLGDGQALHFMLCYGSDRQNDIFSHDQRGDQEEPALPSHADVVIIDLYKR